MPHCEECGHRHVKSCGCGCPQEACENCAHFHGRKNKSGVCETCKCEFAGAGEKEKEKAKQGE